MEFQHINLDFLEKFAKGDRTRMVRYIQMFLKVGPEGISAMEKHYEAQDWDQLKSAAHSLKPQVGYMGIGSLKEVMPRIEEYAREQTHLDEIPDLIRKVKITCQSAFGELEQAVESLKKSA